MKLPRNQWHQIQAHDKVSVKKQGKGIKKHKTNKSAEEKKEFGVVVHSLRILIR